MGLNYEIHYKKGKENIVANALSRRGMDEITEKQKNGELKALSVLKSSWLTEVSDS